MYDFYSFYPFYVFGAKRIYNWQFGRSCGTEFIDSNFTPISLEYKKYYKDNNSKSSFYINENEAPTLSFVVGKKYRFKQEDTTNVGHPLRFYLEEDKTTALIHL